MKGVSMADLHLGFRRHPAREGGRNLREVDVEKAWFLAIENTLEIRPDLVTIAGDIFDHPRVSMYAVKAFRDGLRLLSEAGIPVVVLEGNHDAAKTDETLTPLVIPDDLPDVYIVRKPERIELHKDGKKVSVACFPYVDRGDGESYRLDPDPEADVNVLVMHAAVKGHADGDTLPFFYGGDGAALDVGREAERWDVIACGDFHGFTRLHPKRPAFYSGSIERTSSDIWKEEAPKGIVSWDTGAGTMEFVEHHTRGMLDFGLGDFGLEDSSAFTVNAALDLLTGMESIKGALVRLKLEDFPREEREHLDWSLVRKLKSMCAHFYLDLRYARQRFVDIGDRRDRERGLSLVDEAMAFFEGSPVRDLAFEYLGITADVEDVENAGEVA